MGLPLLLWHYAVTRHGRRFRSREALETWQDRRVRAHVGRVAARSSFYRGHWGSMALSEWTRFPLIDKVTMMANFDTLNTVGFSLDRVMAVALEAETSRDFSPTVGSLTVGLSSGTSGNRGLFLVSPAERMAWAGSILAKLLPGSLLEEHRIAFFLRANSRLYETVGGRRIRFEFFDLFDEVSHHLSRLATFQPDVLVAPPSMLRFIGAAIEEGRLQLGLKRLLAVAEVLDPLDEAILSRQFGMPVHQVYQCTEGFLASSCSLGTLHVNEDLVVIQKDLLDPASGKFAPIVTDFSRLTQPIVRYRLDDVLTEKREPCACGSVFMALESIEGRCDDIFLLPGLDGGTLRPVFPDFIRRAVMLASGEISEYAVRQSSPDEVEVAFSAPPDLRASIEGRIRSRFHELCERQRCLMPQLAFATMPPRAAGRKLRRVERAFQPEGRSD